MKPSKFVTTVIILAMFCVMSISSLAIFRKKISLPKDQVWTSKESVSRTGNYSYVLARLESVYPLIGTDNFSQIQTRLVDSSETLIMDSEYIKLTEGGGYGYLYIKEGYLALKTVYIQFRGNKNDSAEAVVDYYSY